ncbi:MAG: hypothetical protein DYG90_04015 [Chloroflexi bacterium CFX6]|nr:hypothetical protein [Chloroflexi bacterium CFX6]
MTTEQMLKSLRETYTVSFAPHTTEDRQTLVAIRLYDCGDCVRLELADTREAAIKRAYDWNEVY